MRSRSIKTGGHTRHVIRVVGHLLNPVKQVHHQRVHGLETLPGACPLFPNVEDFLLSLIQNGGHRPALGIEGIGGNLITGTHQLAQNRAFTNNFGITPDIARAGHILGQRVEICQPADFLGLALILQLLKYRDHVSWFGGIDQGSNGAKYHAMLIPVKITLRQQVIHTIPRAIVQQQTAQYAGLGLNGVWWYAQLRDLPVLTVVITHGRKYSRHGSFLWLLMLPHRLSGVE